MDRWKASDAGKTRESQIAPCQSVEQVMALFATYADV
jgi:hypothetical protein